MPPYRHCLLFEQPSVKCGTVDPCKVCDKRCRESSVRVEHISHYSGSDLREDDMGFDNLHAKVVFRQWNGCLNFCECNADWHASLSQPNR